MAKKFKAYVERPKPKKRPRVHKKNKNKKEKINQRSVASKNTIDRGDNGNN